MTLRENRWRDRVLLQMLNDGNFDVAAEVPILGKSADLMMRKGRNITVIEFKLDKWQVAIRQAAKHKLSADYSYICLPRRFSTRKQILDTAANVGIGVMAPRRTETGAQLEIILRARKSSEIWRPARRHLLKAFEYKRELPILQKLKRRGK